jgi:putative aldouronate transport system permease protein
MLRTKIRGDFWFQLLVNGFLLGVLLVILIPLWYVLITSLTPLEIFNKEGVSFFLSPLKWSFAAYQQLLGQPRFLRATLNSTIITGAGTALSLTLTVPLAYALSTPTLPGRNLITTLILFTFLFNPGLVPLYLVVTGLGLTDNLLAVILTPAVSVYNTLVMKSFFEGLPEELKEAARMDGANELQVLWSVILPLSKPILLTIGLFYAVWYWNEYIMPILYLNDAKLIPLPVLLRNILASASFNEYVEYNAFSMASIDSLKSAGVLLAMLPMLLIYPWIQRHFTKGTLVGALKE